MNTTESALVADIKARYRRSTEDKLVIQREMAALRDEHGWGPSRIAAETDVPLATVKVWLGAWDEAVRSGAKVSRLTPTGFQAASDRRVARRILESEPLEQVEQMIAGLPPERKKAIAAAAGHGYLGARQERDEAEARRTPAERREAELAGEELARPARQAVAGFASLGIVGHLEQATDELDELIGDASLTPDALRAIARADARWRERLELAEAMTVGREER